MTIEEIQTETNAESVEKPKRSPKAKKTETEQDTSETGSFEVFGTAQLNIYLLNEEKTYGDAIPKFQTEMAACFDLAAYLIPGTQVKCVDILGQTLKRKVTDEGLPVHPGERFLIPTGIIFDIPEGYAMEIYPRSGQSFKKGMTLSNCTANIDADYVEETFVSLTNIGKQSFTVTHGERIAQAKLVKLVETQINLVTERPKQKTSRNGGFGSTGEGK